MERSNLLTQLWEFQDRDGYISKHAIAEISKKLQVSKIEIEGLVTFYHFFHRKPTGKYIVYLNNSVISKQKGFDDVKATFEKETGCTFGDHCENSDLFSLYETSCIGLSDQETAALINFYPFTNLNPTKVKKIVTDLKSGIKIQDIADDPTSKIQFTPTLDKTVFFRPYEIGKVLNNLKQLTPNEIIDIIIDSKLAGRGGAFFPTGLKWKSCKNTKSDKKYVICNADEGEPGTFKDKSLLNNLPFLILEGMILAGYAIGSNKGIIYLRAEYKYLQNKIEKCITTLHEKSYLGIDSCGIKGFNFDIELVVGAGAYVCGAETALIESLEGKRGEPRIRKYFPTQVGLFNKPTIVNNVETFAAVARILEFGSETYANIGTNESRGTKLLSIAGDVAKPGIYEIEWGTTVQEVLELCQATSPNYIQISGPSGECINDSEFNRKICKEDLICGGSFMVFNRSRDILSILENFADFFKHESCGTCTPCRAGNFIVSEKIKKFKRGLCSTNDINDLKEWGNVIKLTSRCGLGQTCTNTIISATEKFKEYFNLKVLKEHELNYEFDMENAINDYEILVKENQNSKKSNLII